VIRIVSPYFVAGVVVGERAAPIIGYMRWWSTSKIKTYCDKKKWRYEIME
jgi:hypothetical protein